MRKEETLIVGREDLIDNSKSKDILLINFTDFNSSMNPFQNNNIVLFIDDNGETKIMKNRFGDDGQSIYKRIIEDVKKNLTDFISSF